MQHVEALSQYPVKILPIGVLPQFRAAQHNDETIKNLKKFGDTTS